MKVRRASSESALELNISLRASCLLLTAAQRALVPQNKVGSIEDGVPLGSSG